MNALSVILPIYNAEKHLRACLDSVLAAAKMLNDVEIICVDDGSTDSSLALLKEYEKNVHSSAANVGFKVISCEHTNAGHCRNVGIAESCGDYLLFLDADDVFAPEMFETLLTAAQETNADVAICRYVEFTDGDDFTQLLTRKGKAVRRVYRDPARTVDIFHWEGQPWDKLIARRLIEKYSFAFQEQRTTNDVFFILTALSVATTIIECSDTFVAYRQHATSLTATRHKSPQCFHNALVGYYDKMCALGIFPNNDRLLKNFFVYSCGQSFWQFESVSGSETENLLFPLLKAMSVRWQWRETLEESGRDPLRLPCCRALSKANSVLEYWQNYAQLLADYPIELNRLKRSRTYRLAQMLSKAIHLLK